MIVVICVAANVRASSHETFSHCTAARARELHGVKDAARAVHGVELVETLEAHAPLACGGLGVAFELHGYSVFHVDEGRASLNTTVAGGLDLLSLGQRIAANAGSASTRELTVGALMATSTRG